jgi:hypothetical protein
MRRPRRRQAATVDLIGFLDILSTVMVIVLLVIAVLALSLGLRGERQSTRVEIESEQPIEEPVPSSGEQPPAPRVELRTVDGRRITGSSTFLLCRGGQLERHDPVSGNVLERWNLLSSSPFAIAQAIGTPTVYMAVAGSCFDQAEALVDAIRSTGRQVGYEPIPEGAPAPWQ